MIPEIYSQLKIDRLIKSRYLDNGISPNFDQIAAIIGKVAGERLGTSGSKIRFNPQAFSPSSASEIQNNIETFALEIKSIYESSTYLKDKTKRIFDKAENQIALINKQAADLSLTACGLAQGRQEGFNLFAWDNLVDFSKIDQNLSSVDIDSRNRGIRLKTRPIYTRIDLSHLEDMDFDVFVIKGDVAGQTIAPGSRLQYAVDNSDSYWLHRLRAISPGTKGLAFQVNLKNTFVINKLVFSPFGADTESGLLVRVLASANGINWRELMPETIQTSPKIIIDGSLILAQYIRIEMVREEPSYRTTDQAGFIYEFGINDLAVFESSYYKKGQFVSKPIIFYDVLGNPQQINKLKFDIYHEIPEGTEIIYYITTDPDSVEGLINVKPGEIIELDTVIEVQEDQGKVRSRYDSNHALISLKLEDNFIPETIRFFRNTYQPDILINGVQAGWSLQDSYYECIFELLEDKEINLGANSAFIDGKKANGIQTIKPGFHTFRTHETNWKIATSESSDPLFPYNHKLIIEGLVGSAIYTGVNFIAASELNLISSFDLIENIANTEDGYFGIYGSYPIVKIPKPPVFLDEIEGWRKEQYAIRYKYISDALSSLTSIKLIAKLSTNNTRVTPVFKGYVVLAGF